LFISSWRHFSQGHSCVSLHWTQSKLPLTTRHLVLNSFTRIWFRVQIPDRWERR
jgi:hypothetical protein